MKSLVSMFVLLFVATPAWSTQTFGEGASFENVTKISEILKKPEAFLGKEVTVSGMIVEVCAKRGCWMKLASDAKHQSIRIKVEDGKMIFPVSARGKRAAARGIFSEVKPKEYQLDATGVVIE